MSDIHFNICQLLGNCHQLSANRYFWDVCINVYTFTESPCLMQTVISLFVGKSLLSWIPEGHAGSWTSLKTLHSSPVCNGWGKTVVLVQRIYIFIWKNLQISLGTGMLIVTFFLSGCTEKICNWTWGNKREHKETPGTLQGGEVCEEFK